MGVSKINDHIQIKIKVSNPNQEPPASSKAPNEDLKDMDALCTFKIKIECQNSDDYCIKDHWPYTNKIHHIKIKIKIANPIQEPPASSKALNQYLKNMDVLCTFKIRVES